MHRTLSALLLAAIVVPAAAHGQKAADRPESRLVPGDVIRLNIWREPDLTGEFLVQEDGNAVLPKVGPVHVTAYTPSELKTHLIDEYSKTLRNPSIEVIVLRRILISGQVANEGVYPVDPTMSLVEALALAGGPTPAAKDDRVILIRGDTETDIDLDEPADVRNLALQSGDQLLVPSASGWAQNWKLLVGMISSTVSLAILLTRDRR
ncbi:MAG TPA: polysaccharide biosynthesis/export family protein [Gemmatimonadota bacterium]|nr:polysaccharide biosynthesis/export family protein [Gemmatimonadota bacterium]